MVTVHPGVTHIKLTARSQSQGDRVVFWGSLLLLLLLPIERIIGPASLRPVDGVLVLLTGYALLKLWRTRQRVVCPLWAPALFILAASLFATALSGPFFGTLGANLITIIQEVYLYLWFIALVNLWKEESWHTLNRLIKMWVAVAVVEAGLVLLGMLHWGPAFLYTIPYRTQHTFEGFGRGLGTYINPNAAGSFLSISFFVTLGAPVRWWLRVILAGWLFLGMYATGSNGAMGSSAAVLMLLVFVYSIQRRRQRLLLWVGLAAWGGALLALAGLYLLDAPLLSSSPWLAREGIFGTSLGRAYYAALRRFALADWALVYFTMFPWGVGPNTFGELMASLHNDYLAFLFERGPVGFFSWVLLAVQPMLTGFRASLRVSVDPGRQWQMLALAGGFLASAANMVLHELSHTRALWLLMALIFAQAYLAANRNKNDATISYARSRAVPPVLHT